jgi:O-methyltransferase
MLSPPTQSTIYCCPRRPKRRSSPEIHPESGERRLRYKQQPPPIPKQHACSNMLASISSRRRGDMRFSKSTATGLVNRVLRFAGAELRRIQKEPVSAPDGFTDLEPWVAEIIAKVRPFTMTSNERISALCHAVRYVARSNIPGDIVECGVWRGGSMMAAAMTLLSEGETRTLHLYDTFEGMPPPTPIDRRISSGKLAAEILEESDKSSVFWAYAALDEVQANLVSTGYSRDRIHFIRGKVEETIPNQAPERISVLRLDTDWYESTKCELINLYPRLSVGGVLIIDDYGFWNGAQKATDEYIREQRLPILLQRIDSESRIAVKTGPGTV